jgi:ABC-type transport system involved in cytochrome bd biosynthesis fused ATPase/permease subunit
MLDTENLRDTMGVLSQAAMSSLVMVITHDYDLAQLFDIIWRVGNGGTVTIEGGGPEKAAPVLRAHTKNVRKNLQMELGEELSL